MNCNISAVIIFLLLIVIIGMIVVSQKKTEKILDKEVDKEVEIKLKSPRVENVSVVEGFNLMEDAQKIQSNNETINNLLSNLQNYKPIIQMIGYSSAGAQNKFEQRLSDNVKIVDDSLFALYKSNNDAIANKLEKLKKKAADIKRSTENLKKESITKKNYQQIKSLNNGMEMDLITTPNTRFQDEQTGSNIAAYMVSVNNGCLSVGATDYDVYKCDDKNTKQYFKMEHILNETAYQNAIDSALPFDNIDKSKINYPFVMMKSINNENCLTNTNGNLTVQPCYSFVAQRWMAL